MFLTLWVGARLLAVLALALLCHGIGRAVIGRLPCTSAGLRVVVATGLGFGIIGQLLFVIGSIGALTRTVVIALLVVLAIPAFWYLRELRAHRWVLIVLFAGSVLTFLRALYPPAGSDPTVYHLTYARLFAEAGSLVYADTLRYPVFPQLNEMLFTAALLVADDVTAQLVQWLAHLVTAAAIAALVRTMASRSIALLAAAIWFSVPVVSLLASQAWIECGLAMAVLLAFVAWSQWRSTSHAGWIVVAGAFAGMAAATKYHGLFFVVLMGVAVMVVAPRQIASFLLGVIVFAAPWYLRIWALTGNPLFPYFGASEWGLTLRHSMSYGTFDVYNLRYWLPLLALPAAIGAWIDRRVRFLFLGAIAYVVVVWRFDARFMMVSIPLFAVCTVMMFKRVPALLVALALIPAIVVGTRDLQRRGPIPVTKAQRDAFLEKRIWPYRALQFLARNTAGKPAVYVYRAPVASYYWSGRFLGERFGPYRYDLLPLHQPERLARVLRSFGADYFIARRGDRFAMQRIYEDDQATIYCVDALSCVRWTSTDSGARR